jgi:hypothetical protein
MLITSLSKLWIQWENLESFNSYLLPLVFHVFVFSSILGSLAWLDILILYCQYLFRFAQMVGNSSVVFVVHK